MAGRNLTLSSCILDTQIAITRILKKSIKIEFMVFAGLRLLITLEKRAS
jgi:hypothetical protein